MPLNHSQVDYLGSLDLNVVGDSGLFEQRLIDKATDKLETMWILRFLRGCLLVWLRTSGPVMRMGSRASS